MEGPLKLMYGSNFESKKNWRPPTAKIKENNNMRAKHAEKFTIFRCIFNKINDFYVIK